jgi:hypothetical protein
MTTNAWAKIENEETGESRKVLTQPFTNYNVLVLDQNLKNNSYVTLINTNYLSPKDDYLANVTGAETRICNKKSTFAVFGRLNLSNKAFDGNNLRTGHAMEFNVSKPNGKFQYYLIREQADKVYDPNDMGFLLNNNYASNTLHLYYIEQKPKGIMVSTTTRLTSMYNTLFESSKFKYFAIEAANKTTYSNFWITHMVVTASPLGYHDYYEPRTWGYVYKKPAYYSADLIVATDSRKRFYLRSQAEWLTMPDNHSHGWQLELTPRMRFTDKATLTLDVNYSKTTNDYGWVADRYDSAMLHSVIFGKRDVATLSTILSGQYTFSKRTSLTLRLRHYWSQVDYSSYFTLNSDGSLSDSYYNENHDINFNAFTADAQFVWYFAPGSELSVVWKNAINTFDNTMISNYFDNLDRTFNTPQANSFSIRILYYLDYQYIRKLIS